MQKYNHYTWLWATWALWLIALVAWKTAVPLLYTGLITLVSLVLLLIFVARMSPLKKQRTLTMALFKSTSKESVLPLSTPSASTQPADPVKPGTPLSEGEALSRAKTSKVTFIAQNARLVGDMQLDGDIHIDGYVEGNISTSGTITVMLNGDIKGELRAASLVINGQVNGVCDATNIEILEKGQVQGSIRSDGLSVLKGGVFIGNSELKGQGDLLPTRPPKNSGKSASTEHPSLADMLTNQVITEKE